MNTGRCDNLTCNERRGHRTFAGVVGDKVYCSLTCRILDGLFGPDAATWQERHMRKLGYMAPLDEEIDADEDGGNWPPRHEMAAWCVYCGEDVDECLCSPHDFGYEGDG